MKKFLLSVIVLACAGLHTVGMSMSREGEVKLDARLNSPVIASSGGTVFLHITLETRGFAPRHEQRRPMNIAVVLDRSGSMADERKIDYAKSALNKLIDQLHSEDIFSLVVYDDAIDVLRDARRVGRNKQSLKSLVNEISPRNSTNLGGGMMEGFRQVGKHLSSEYVNRVILLSDGLANQGITNPVELNRIARKHRNKSISLTTMGVGLEYNENLMVGLAESGGGNYYFIESPHQLASIMDRELNAASNVVAQNAYLHLQCGKGVTLVDVIGCESVLENGVYRIPIGDVAADEVREVTVELAVPKGSDRQTLASGTLHAEGFSLRPAFSTTVAYTNDVAYIEQSRDLDVQAKVDIAVSTRTVEKAMKALDEGRTEEAKAELRAAKDALANSPAAWAGGESAAVVQEQADRLNSFENALSSAGKDTRQAKKSIQYENYRVQKKK